MMTGEELTDIRAIASAAIRIERKVDDQRVQAELRDRETNARLDKLERFADRAEGAITALKFIASFLGIGGVAAIVAVVSRGGL
jgi:hypothetical protein